MSRLKNYPHLCEGNSGLFQPEKNDERERERRWEVLGVCNNLGWYFGATGLADVIAGWGRYCSEINQLKCHKEIGQYKETEEKNR